MAINPFLIKVGLKGASAVVSGMKGIGSAVKSVSGSVLKLATSWKTMFGATAFIGTAINESVKFGDQLKEIQTIGGQTADELKELSVSLRDVADDFGQDIGSVAKAQYDIISAGIEGTTNQLNVLKASTELAVAGVSDVGTTADVITSAMNAYGQANLSASHASNLLFQTVESGKTTIPELGASLGQVLPFASDAGIGLDIVGSAMATITASGVKTAEATTALKSAIVALNTPTEGAKKAMDDLNFSVSKTSDGGVDLVKTLDDLAQLDSETIAKFIPSITGQLAVKTLANDMKAFKDQTIEFTEVSETKTADAVRLVTDSFGSQSRILKEKLRSAMIEVGDAITKRLLPKIKSINEELEFLGDIGWNNIGMFLAENIGEVMSFAGQVVSLQAQIFGLQITDMIHQGMKDGFPKIHALFRTFSLMMAKITGGDEAMMAKLVEFRIDDAGINESQMKITELKETMTNLLNEGYVKLIEGARALGEVQTEEAEMLGDFVIPQIDGLAEVYDNLGEGAEESGKKQQQNSNELVVANERQYASTVGAVRGQIRAWMAQAFASMIAKEAGKGLVGIATATIGATLLGSLFDSLIPSFAQGGQLIADKPQLFLAGEAGRERITVEREDGAGFQRQGGNVTVNISAPLVDETVRDSILPSIQSALRSELA